MNLRSYDMFRKMAHRYVKYTHFVVNGLKHAQPPVWYFNVAAGPEDLT